MKRSNGEGTVYYNEKRSRYEGQYSYKDSTSGTMKRKFFSSTKSAKDVRDKAKEFVKGIEAGIDYTSSIMTLGSWLTTWLEIYKKNEIRLKTIERYRLTVNSHINPCIGNIPLKNLTSEHIQGHLNFLRIQGGVKGEGLAPRTVNAVRRVLIQALEAAYNADYLMKNVANNTKSSKAAKQKIAILTHAEADNLMRVAKEYTYTAWIIVVVAIGTGMRLSEVFGLHWDFINLDKKELRVERSAVKVNGKTILQDDLKTSSSRRVIQLPEFVVSALKEYQQWQKEYIDVTDSYVDSGNLISNRCGEVMHPASFSYHIFKNILLKRANIPTTFRFHDLRHTHATWLLEGGAHIKAVSERLGHANIRITLDTYAHVLKSMQDKAVETLDVIFSIKDND